MKKIIITSILALFFTASYAQVKGSLTIYTKEGEKIWVIKNGVKQNKEAATNVVITDITDKYFKVKVIIDDESMTSIDKQIQMIDVDEKMCNITYELRKKKNSYGLSIISWDPVTEINVKVTENRSNNEVVQPKEEPIQTNVGISNNGMNQTTTTGQTQTNVGMGQNGANITIKDPELGVDFNMNMNIPNGQGTVTSSTTTTTTTTRTGNNTNVEQVVTPQPKTESREIQKHPRNPNPTRGCVSAMPTGDFSDAKAQVKKAPFADGKLTIAKQITESNCLSVLQIKEIAKEFSFEDNKLEYLKFAYDFTFEKNKYYLVNDVLNFSSSKDELNSYIQSKK